MKAEILLLSAYDADSHRYWHQNLSLQLNDFNWHRLTLKDQFFKWRMAANAINFAHQYDPQLQQNYDLVVATSMTDLTAVRGFYPHLAGVPNLLYFHENQFAYPLNARQNAMATIHLNSLMSAYLADEVVFNSDYNRRSFLAGAKRFLQKMPDGIPADFLKSIEAKATLLPVPIMDDCQPSQSVHQATQKPYLQVVWNHRWEHDKGPETLLSLLALCQGLPIRFHILGRAFKTIPRALRIIKEKHANQCLSLGYVNSRAEYIRVLQQADVVLSTANHDFQGIAMLEAAACGCRPLAPNRLVYPDLYPPENLYPATPDNPEKQARVILDKLLKPGTMQQVQPLMSWSHWGAQYRQWIQQWL